MKKFEIRQTVIEITIVEAVDEETAMEIFLGGGIDVTSYGKIGGGDDICIKEIKEDYAHQRFINKSIDCYKCNALVDEREVMPNESKYGGDDNGGYLCKACVTYNP